MPKRRAHQMGRAIVGHAVMRTPQSLLAPSFIAVPMGRLVSTVSVRRCRVGAVFVPSQQRFTPTGPPCPFTELLSGGAGAHLFGAIDFGFFLALVCCGHWLNWLNADHSYRNYHPSFDQVPPYLGGDMDAQSMAEATVDGIDLHIPIPCLLCSLSSPLQRDQVGARITAVHPS